MVNPYINEDDPERPLKKWETAVDEAIRLGQERGEFDNLPGQGKPLSLQDNPYAAGLDIGYGVLKNANVAPYWIEVDKEIRAELTALQDLRERTARRMSTLLASGEDQYQPNARLESQQRRWWPLRRKALSPQDSQTSNRPLAVSERARTRNEYLERAAKLEEKIAYYNSSLPRELWQLERTRRTPEQYAVEFDKTCPPVDTSVGFSSLAQSLQS